MFKQLLTFIVHARYGQPLSDIVSKDKLALFSTPQAKQRSRSKEQVASLKTKCTLFFSRLYIACQASNATPTVSLHMKIRRASPSISDMGQLRQGSKSDIMECLALDGVAIVNMVRPGACRHLRSIPRK